MADADPIQRLNAALEGRYRIERELGAGGMATVYQAEDLRHRRNVALKVLKPELAAVVGSERFLAEIETTASLQHPHILPLFDSGEADGFLFYVMPYVEGESLRERLDRKHQLPVDEAVTIASKVASALDYAHQHGVIHRDVKPANILLSESGEPLVLDFGIALAVSAGGGDRLTETGLSLGTPHYMSPEQATGDLNVGPQTDIWALGCVLYEMLVGEPPYTGSTPQAVLGRIITADVPSASNMRRAVPPHVEATIAKALEKVPADRLRTASEFVTALDDPGFLHVHAVEATGATARGTGSAGPWNRLAVAMTTLAVVMTLAFGWALLRPEPPEPVTRQVLSAEGWAGLVPGVGQYVALAPDGSSMILPIETASGAQALGLKLRGSTEVTPIPDTEGAQDVKYSPDGEWIVYAIGAELFKRPLIGGSALRLAEDANGGGQNVSAWLDDGTILYDAGTSLVQIPEDGGEPLGVVDFSPERLVWVHGLPGSSGALVGVPLPDLKLYAVDLGDLSSEVILEGVIRAWYAPTGHVVYVRRDGAVFAQPFDLGSLTLSGSAVPLFDGVRGFIVPHMWLAADGTLLYVEATAGLRRSGSSQLTVVDLAGNTEMLALAPRHIASSSAGWSPDGASIVFPSEDQIYTYDAVLNTTPRQITFEGDNIRPVYSPDGAKVAFSSFRDGTDEWDLFVKDLNDDAPPRSIITLDANQFMMGWPADTLIVFERNEGGVRDLWLVDISDPDNPEARPYLTSEADLERIAVSPDGTLAAYRSDESGQDALYVRSFPTPGERTIVYSGGTVAGISWSPDGGTLYAFTGRNQPVIAVRLQRDPVPAVLDVDTLFTSPEGFGPALGSVLHPDGDRFILVGEGSIETADEAQEPYRLILVLNFFEELKRLVPN